MGRGPARVALAALALGLLLAPRAGRALPRFVVGVGATAASSDGPQNSGAAVSGAALWDYGVIELGPTLFLDDLGSTVGRLKDPNDGTDLGAVPTTHRLTLGAGWRADARLGVVKGWTTRATGSWGYYRVRDDQVGITQQALSAIGLGVGMGISHHVTRTTALGISGQYHRIADSRQNQYVNVGLDLIWEPEAPAVVATARARK